MSLFFQQSKITQRFIAVFATLVLVLSGVLIQKQVLKVSADVQVLLVSDTALPFGRVFPGQVLTRTYTVQLDTSADLADYSTSLEPVDGFGDLCPHLHLTNIDVPVEADTLASASLTRPEDLVDDWQVLLDTPGISGQIAQDHTGGIVVTAGNYSCKITVVTPLLEVNGQEKAAPVADLQLTKTVDNNAPQPSTPIVYTMFVSNSGPDTATNVSLTDILPLGITFVSATATQGSFNDISGIWTVGDLLNGQSATLTIHGTVKSDTAGSTITNSANVLSGTGDPNLSNNVSVAIASVSSGDCTSCGGSNEGGNPPPPPPTPPGPPASPSPSPSPSLSFPENGEVLGNNTSGVGLLGEPSVLGAATELPKTGIPPSAWIFLSMLTLSLGFVSLKRKIN